MHQPGRSSRRPCLCGRKRVEIVGGVVGRFDATLHDEIDPDRFEAGYDTGQRFEARNDAFDEFAGVAPLRSSAYAEAHAAQVLNEAVPR